MVERRREQVERLHELLVERVEAVQAGADWQRLLDFAGRFYRYSADNQLLIALAHERAFREGRVPDPSPRYVAGFRTWQALGRSVDKGQRGYPILAPASYRTRAARAPDGTQRRLEPGERASVGEELVRGPARLRGFTVAYVWDVSQTSGAPLPEPPRPQLLQGEAPPGLHTQLSAFLVARGFTVRDVPGADVIGGANGLTDFTTRMVSVRADMDAAARVKTLAHEAGHVLLHDSGADEELARLARGHRGRAEVEAESLAYVLGAAHGMDTAGYSLAYVTAWAASAEPAEVVRATARRVVAAAQDVLAGLDTEHGSGGQPPGVARALTRDATERSGRPAHVVSAPAAGPPMAIGAWR